MITPYTDLTREQFKGFLLAYSSHVDFKFSDEEKDIIIKSLPRSSDQILDYYYSQSENEQIQQIIEGVFKHIKTDKDLLEFNKALELQFIADGEYCRFEKCFYKYFNELAQVNIQ